MCRHTPVKHAFATRLNLLAVLVALLALMGLSEGTVTHAATMAGAASSISSQGIGDAQIEITPPIPSSADDISIRVFGEWGNVCVPSSPQVSVVSDQIFIELLTPPPDTICAQVITSWQETVVIGQLPVGIYEVLVTLIRDGEMIGETELTVVPGCTLELTPSYDTGILTVEVLLGTSVPATANLWGASQSNIIPIITGQSVPVTDPPITQSISRSVSPQGIIGLLATITTPDNNIICSDFQRVNTGSAP